MSAPTTPAEPSVELEKIAQSGDLAPAMRETERLVRAAVTERPQVDSALTRPEGVLAQVLRPGDRLTIVDLEHLRDDPRVKQGAVVVHDAASLVSYVRRHAAADETTLWATQRSTGAAEPTIVAVINDHTTVRTGDATIDTRAAVGWGSAGWADHRATLRVQVDPDWQAWAVRELQPDGRGWMTQTTFGEFLQSQLHAVVEPSAASLLSAITTFTQRRTVEYKSAVNLNSGETQFAYAEENGRNAGAETVPNRLTVRLRPFYGAGLHDLQVWLRHRLSAKGELTFGLVRIRPDLVEDGAWADVCDQVRDGLPELPLLQGVAPADRRGTRAVEVLSAR